MSLASMILEDTFSSPRPWSWPRQSIYWPYILDSIPASDDDDVFTLWQPLYESIGHILRWSSRNFAERLHNLLS